MRFFFGVYLIEVVRIMCVGFCVLCWLSFISYLVLCVGEFDG